MMVLMVTFVAVMALLTPASAFSGAQGWRRVLKAVQVAATTADMEENRVIDISEKAMNHLNYLLEKGNSEKRVLRMGVKAGGCSGMSYEMNLVADDDIGMDDQVIDLQGIKCIVDPKSVLLLNGLQLDYSDELIGGGFKFANPNAEKSCGCGKSFGV
jgi:iron-sulfur cluster assembly protein